MTGFLEVFAAVMVGIIVLIGIVGFVVLFIAAIDEHRGGF
jgi:hypothetical protein